MHLRWTRRTSTSISSHSLASLPRSIGNTPKALRTLQFSFKSIAYYYIRRASLINLTGLAGSSNIKGDDQKKLDVIASNIFISSMRRSRKCHILVSEEEDGLIKFDEHPNARYIVVCDAIDRSSSLDIGVSVGTIFGIF